jgi:hypothetical protein
MTSGQHRVNFPKTKKYVTQLKYRAEKFKLQLDWKPEFVMQKRTTYTRQFRSNRPKINILHFSRGSIAIECSSDLTYIIQIMKT